MLIAPDDEWQLDHRDDGRGWLGPSHRTCNARAAWKKMVTVSGANGNDAVGEDAPFRWSRRWYEEPPVGTEVLLRDGLVEIHVGCGIWQTVAA